MGEQTVVSRARNLGANDVDAARQQAISGHPTGRLGVPDDIAKASFFSPPRSAFMTGAGLAINGGATAQ
jgi:NAD(P)-dependent dehydrogenase (short-subunit alcohol dehydrogenase family)